MAGFTTGNNAHLIRSQLWSNQLKEVVLDELMGWKWVDMITDFPDGDTINIPSVGQASVYNYAENMPIRYSSVDTGNFQFSINDYVAGGSYLTEKMKQDSMYMSRVYPTILPKFQRALMEKIEQRVMATGPEGQTASNSNTINGAKHRWVASGANATFSLEDFAKAKYALDKANMPANGRVAIVDASVEAELNKLTNIVNVSNNPSFEGKITTGFGSDLTKINSRIYGFDIYISRHLKPITTSETIDTVASGTSAVANVFFSTASDLLPIVGLMRQAPKVDSEYNKDKQREEFVVTARYGFKLFRPENMVTVLSATDQVYA